MSAGKKVLIVGNWHWDIYEEALANGFRSNGWTVLVFVTDKYLSLSTMGMIQTRLRLGTTLGKLNKALVSSYRRSKPDIVFFYRSDLILAETLKLMKKINEMARFVIYHNDNPFIGFHNKLKYRHYLACIPYADLTLAYRPSNISDAQAYGARNVALFPPNYLSYRHRPIPASVSTDCDVVYIGHYEADGRAEILDYLIKNGVKIGIFGENWGSVKNKYSWPDLVKVTRIWGDQYARLISSAKIALVFLSHKHRDVYTRRCFEITACGTLMMAPRTHELEGYFKDGKEAVYFDSKQDLLQKIRYYLVRDSERIGIAQTGRKRCVHDGHDEISRVRQLIKALSALGY